MHNVSDSAETLVMASNLSLLLGEKPNQPSSSFKFPKTKFGKEEKKKICSVKLVPIMDLVTLSRVK